MTLKQIIILCIVSAIGIAAWLSILQGPFDYLPVKNSSLPSENIPILETNLDTGKFQIVSSTPMWNMGYVKDISNYTYAIIEPVASSTKPNPFFSVQTKEWIGGEWMLEVDMSSSTYHSFCEQI